MEPMKKVPWYMAALILLIASCQHKIEKKLIGTWQARHLENPVMEELMAEQLQFLDTFGRSTTPEQNLKIYGSRNVDSIRESLTRSLEEMKILQDSAVRNTWFQFRKDGVAMMNFGGQKDSAHWYINDEDQLVLDEMGLKGSGARIYMDFVQLSDEVMTLRFTEDGLTSTVEFFAVESESAPE